MDELEAHAFSANHQGQLTEEQKCGCFYCLRIFRSSEIGTWISDPGGTALCPYCGVDAVVGEGAGVPITREFLEKMKKAWF